MEFKEGDIIKIVGHISFDEMTNKYPGWSEGLDNNLIEDLRENGFRVFYDVLGVMYNRFMPFSGTQLCIRITDDLNIGPIRINEILASTCEVKLATDREKFLYYTHGSLALKE